MTEVVRINATLHSDLLDRIDFYAKQNYEDRSTAIRQLIAEGLKQKLKDNVIESFENKRITIREAAELLGVDYWEMQSILEEKGIPFLDLSEEEVKRRIKE